MNIYPCLLLHIYLVSISPLKEPFYCNLGPSYDELGNSPMDSQVPAATAEAPAVSPVSGQAHVGRVGSGDMGCNPKGAIYCPFKDSGSKRHTRYSFWNQSS